jgi:DNA polymerase III subunit gamma/tau
MSLYQRIRPISFDEVAGNDETVKNLAALTAQPEPPHAYLLTGPSGCGKTTLGRIIALALGVSRDDVLGQFGDYRELDNAHFRGIDTIREIRDGAGYVGLHGARRCWLLDEVHGLGKLQQDALLKGLEDPPAHAYFVLCTTEPDSLRETIRSRCSIHRVSPLSEQHMVALLHGVAKGEGRRLDRKLLRTIWEKTDGKPRAAVQLLEKVLAADDASVDAVISSAEATKETVDGLARALIRRTGWKSVAEILSRVEEDDVESVRRGIMGYCSAVLLRGEDDHAMVILDQMIEPFFQSGRAGLIHACYTISKGA